MRIRSDVKATASSARASTEASARSAAVGMWRDISYRNAARLSNTAAMHYDARGDGKGVFESARGPPAPRHHAGGVRLPPRRPDPTHSRREPVDAALVGERRPRQPGREQRPLPPLQSGSPEGAQADQI